MSTADLKGVYLITDTHIQNRHSHVALAEMAFRAGVQLVQYRNKEATDREVLQTVREMNALEGKGSQLLMVNDRPDLAIVGNADGVHLGQQDLPIPVARRLMGEDAVIGGTASNLQEAQQVEAAGADYVALGHIFETSTKQKEYPPRGVDTLHEVSESVTVPLVAIGGITLGNASEVIAAGADMIALGSAICTADDPFESARQFVELFE